jgi:hypothetical protein
MVGLAVALRALGAQAQVCAPPDFAGLLVVHGQQAAPDETGNLVLWDRNVRGLQAAFGAPVNAFRASLGLPAVDNVRNHAYTDHPWLAADPVLAPWPGRRRSRPGPDRRPGRLLRRGRGQPAGAVPPRRRRRAPRRRGHDGSCTWKTVRSGSAEERAGH